MAALQQHSLQVHGGLAQGIPPVSSSFSPNQFLQQADQSPNMMQQLQAQGFKSIEFSKSPACEQKNLSCQNYQGSQDPIHQRVERNRDPSQSPKCSSPDVMQQLLASGFAPMNPTNTPITSTFTPSMPNTMRQRAITVPREQNPTTVYPAGSPVRNLQPGTSYVLSMDVMGVSKYMGIIGDHIGLVDTVVEWVHELGGEFRVKNSTSFIGASGFITENQSDALVLQVYDQTRPRIQGIYVQITESRPGGQYLATNDQGDLTMTTDGFPWRAATFWSENIDNMGKDSGIKCQNNGVPDGNGGCDCQMGFSGKYCSVSVKQVPAHTPINDVVMDEVLVELKETKAALTKCQSECANNQRAIAPKTSKKQGCVIL